MSIVQFEGADYDLTEFSHPGGSVIRATFGMDATAVVHAYHPDVKRVRLAIASYKLSDNTATEGSYKGPLYAELKRRVHTALQKKKESTGADFWLRFKMVTLMVSYVLCLLWLSNSTTKTSCRLAACSLGFTGVLVGLNIMHDASHLAIESGPYVWWNYAWQLSGDMIGMSTLGWRYQHVIQHHVHTDNKDDPDAAFLYPLMRVSEEQPHLPIHYLQSVLVIPVIHALSALFQVFDTVHVITGVYTWEGLRKPIGTRHTKQEWAQFLFAKVCILVQWGMLFHKGGLEAWTLWCLCSSIVLGTIDVPGHYTQHPPLPTKLPPSIQQGDVIDTWLLEQLHNTNTFAPHLNGVFGGLNMQIEHHLFPRVSHRHYPFMRPIIQKFCQEHGLPYNDYSFFGVIFATFERVVRLSFPPQQSKVKGA